jgi:hypothetical protein
MAIGLYVVILHVDGVSLNCDHQRAYCSFPRWYMSMEPRWDDTDRKLGQKAAPVPLVSPQISHGLTRASAAKDRWLTTWAMARLIGLLVSLCCSVELRGYCSLSHRLFVSVNKLGLSKWNVTCEDENPDRLRGSGWSVNCHKNLNFSASLSFRILDEEEMYRNASWVILAEFMPVRWSSVISLTIIMRLNNLRWTLLHFLNRDVTIYCAYGICCFFF